MDVKNSPKRCRRGLLLNVHAYKLTRGRTAQCVPYSSTMPCRLGGWIAVRLRRRWGLPGADEYLGLRPGSKLVTTHKFRSLANCYMCFIVHKSVTYLI